MKILEVCPYDFARPGGVQLHIRDLSRALAALGHEVTVLAPGPAPATQAREPFRTVYAGNSRAVSFNQTRFELSLARGKERKRLESLLSEGGFDVIHYHTIWTPLLPFQVFKRSRAANVATFHDMPPDTFMGRATRRLF